MEYTADEYRIYLKVKHALLYEDAMNFVTEYLADKNNCYADELEGINWDKYNYEYLVSEFENNEDANTAFNDTWESVVNEYMENFEDDEDEED